VPRDKLPHIYLDRGTEDRLFQINRDFVTLLMEHRIPPTYSESPGGHTAPYRARELRLAMAVQYAIIRRATASAKPERHAGARR